jgi:hypothetical protein
LDLFVELGKKQIPAFFAVVVVVSPACKFEKKKQKLPKS